VIDTHCHLTFPDFAEQVDVVVADALAAGVTGLITISTTTTDCLDALAIARSQPRVWCSAGVHPLYADPATRRRASDDQAPDETPRHIWPNLHRVASDPRCVGWGELGLDNHYPEPPPALQRQVLDEQLSFITQVNHDRPGGINKPAGLPLILHCREAFGDLIPVLKNHGIPGDRCVFHCFTAGEHEMRALLDFGAMVSFTGVVTYPSARELREAAKLAPADRIMVETDAPFLPPVPHRGARPCLPAWVAFTARALAELRGASFEQFHHQLNDNTRRFFAIEP
jgi:TatD DNase family protein